MKKNKSILILFSLAWISHLYANQTELFPLRGIIDVKDKINAAIYIEKIKDKPFIDYFKSCKMMQGTNSIGEVLAIHPVELKDSRYWRSATVFVVNGIVVSIAYLPSLLDFEKVKDKLPMTMRALFTFFGRDFDFALDKRYHTGRGYDDNDPILIWKRDNCFYTFVFTPPDKYVRGNDFFFELSIILDEKDAWSKEFLLPRGDDLDKDNYSTWELLVKINKDKSATERLKKECEAYFSSLEE